MKFHAVGDSGPPNILLKQEGLQLVFVIDRPIGTNIFCAMIIISHHLSNHNQTAKP